MQAMLVGLAGLVVGVCAALAAPAGAPPLLVMGDLLVGWTFLGLGVLVWVRVPSTRTGLLLIATSFAWFAPVILPMSVFLNRAVLAQAVMAYPTGRLRSPVARGLVAAAYVVALLGVTISPPLTSAILGTWLVVIGIARLAARRRIVGAVPAGVSALLVGAVSLVALGGRIVGIADGATWLLAYDLAVVSAAVLLGADLLVRRGAGTLVTQLVVDLGDAGRSGGVRDRLARALGDPDLVVGFAVQGSQEGFVDERGVAVAVPNDGDRVVTPMVVAGETVGILVHDPAVLDDPRLVDAVAAATRFAVANARLQASEQALIAEVAASRSRLVHAGDASAEISRHGFGLARSAASTRPGTQSAPFEMRGNLWSLSPRC